MIVRQTFGLDEDTAAQAAASLKAQWSLQNQVNEELRNRTNENFERLAASRKLPPDQFRTWSDPQTGLRPDEAKHKTGGAVDG